MKWILHHNECLLAVANSKLKLLIKTDYDKNYPGPYYEMVDKQLDYVNLIKERIKLINEKVNADSK